MLRTFPVVLCSVAMLITACKKADKPAGDDAGPGREGRRSEHARRGPAERARG